MSVIKPDSVIGCVGENDVYRNSSKIDVVYDGKTGYDGWIPVIPRGNWKTWLIYKFNRQKKITKINFTIVSDENNSCRIAKNIDTSYNSERLSVPMTMFTINYKNLNVIDKDANNNTVFKFDTISIINFSYDENSQDGIQVENYNLPINNVDNLLFIFEKPVRIMEIECIGENSPLPYLKSEKSNLTLRKFIPKNYSMFIDSIDTLGPREINSILLINNNIYFCRYEDNGSVRINVSTKDGTPLDHIFIPNLPDKTKLRETILNGTGYNILTSKPNNVYKYTPTGEYKTVAQWRTFLSPFIISGDVIKNLYENGDESINLNPNTNTTINTGTHVYYVNALQTDRIFIYDNTNKLVHVTDYIPKGTPQDVTIDYNLGINSIKSSIIPVNPLPVPNFYKSNLSSDCINSIQYFSCPSSPDMICPDNYIIDTINNGPQTIKYRCKNIYSTSENFLRGLGNNPTSETTSDNSGFAKSKTYWLSDGIRGINFTKGNDDTVLTGSANGNISNFSCDNGKINGFNGGIFKNTGNIIQLKTFCALPTIK